MRHLMKRLAKLEVREVDRRICFVVRELENGRLVPARPGCELAPRVAVMPEVCETVDEWFRLYVPKPSDGSAGRDLTKPRVRKRAT